MIKAEGNRFIGRHTQKKQERTRQRVPAIRLGILQPFKLSNDTG